MRLSIITINKNNALGLEKTIQSVVNQTYNDFEYIVIDGNSMDESVEIIKKHSSKIIYWVSETDTGIYNAMNKGIRKAQGEYCLFLNSGDWLISSTTLQDVFNEISNNTTADIFYSDLNRTDGTVNKFPDNLSIIYLIKGPISHQNSLIKRSLFFEHGFYNEDLFIASDWEFFLYELWKYKSDYVHISTCISVFDAHGAGSIETVKHYKERLTVIQNVFNELADLVIEYKYYHNSAFYELFNSFYYTFRNSNYYRKNIENLNKTKLFFLFELYKFIIEKMKKIGNTSINFFLIRILRRIFVLSVKVFTYFFEFMGSAFDKKIRLSFSNFGDTPQNFFIIPICKVLESYNCSYKIAKYYNPHIYFFSVFEKKNKVIKSKAPCKIYFPGEETSHNSKEFKENCIDIVSLAFGFDYTEADNYLRLPLWLLHYFSPDNSKDEIRKILSSFKNHYKKVKFCSLVSNDDPRGIKIKMYNEISKIKAIDCPGNFLHNDDSLYEQYSNEKDVYLQQYKFSICPENTINQGYVTEKLFQSLYSGCIPIYNGWSKNPEPDVLNPNIILWFDENDTSTLVNDVKKINSDDKLYRLFMEQPFFCDNAVDKIHIMLQQFTDKMQYTVKEIIKEQETNFICL
jgi:glycosyltransferase involved in cell wall biosynthesis